MTSPDRIEVAHYTRGQVGPSQPMVGPVAPGAVIMLETAPGCWGPMITPHFRGLQDLADLVIESRDEFGRRN